MSHQHLVVVIKMKKTIYQLEEILGIGMKVFAKFIPMTKTRLVVVIKVVLVVLEVRMLIGRILIRFENLKNQFKLELNQNQKQIQFLNLLLLKKNQKNHPFRQKE